jgi:creatinine amidohydrolase/Fe(II)-dependent formamide hydrolase-like protein
LQPDLVDKELIGPHLTTIIDESPRLRGNLARGYVPFSVARDAPEGVSGDPTAASADKGERVVEAAVGVLVEFLRGFRAL